MTEARHVSFAAQAEDSEAARIDRMVKGARYQALGNHIEVLEIISKLEKHWQSGAANRIGRIGLTREVGVNMSEQVRLNPNYENYYKRPSL